MPRGHHFTEYIVDVERRRLTAESAAEQVSTTRPMSCVKPAGSAPTQMLYDMANNGSSFSSMPLRDVQSFDIEPSILPHKPRT